MIAPNFRHAEHSAPSFVVELGHFTGPLDLLLSLIRDEQLDIYDIPIARIAEQFLARISTLGLDEAADYLEMAARLLRIKAQMLLPRADGKGRVVSLEILVPTPGIRNLIREDKVHQIYSVMQTGQGASGMQTMNQALYGLLVRKAISMEEAELRSPDPLELRSMVEHGVGGGRRPR